MHHMKKAAPPVAEKSSSSDGVVFEVGYMNVRLGSEWWSCAHNTT